MMEVVERFIEDDKQARFRSASGHLRHHHIKRIQESLPRARLMTVLRDPIERLVSDFNYVRSDRHPEFEDCIRQYPTLTHFVNSAENCNRMSHFILPKARVGREDMVEYIYKHFQLIGTVENYPVFFRFFTALAGIPCDPQERANQAAGGAAPTLDSATVTLIEKLNEHDMNLYHRVKADLDSLAPAMMDFVASKERRLSDYF